MVACSKERNNNDSDPIKCGKFLNHSRGYHLSRRTLLSELVIKFKKSGYWLLRNVWLSSINFYTIFLRILKVMN